MRSSPSIPTILIRENLLFHREGVLDLPVQRINLSDQRPKATMWRGIESSQPFDHEEAQMATPDQLRTMITARPFLPFLVKLASGQSFTVKHPENASCDPRGRSMVVQDDEGMHLLEMLLVEVMKPLKTSAKSPTEGNGP